jgi:hypothetical protein
MKRILVVTANPSGTQRLRLDQEVNAILNSLQLPQQRVSFDVRQRTGTTRLLLQQSLYEHQPHIVHFALHGEAQEIILEDENGNTDRFTSAALADLFRQCMWETQCVILNSCYSEGQLALISAHIPYVIGMNGAIFDTLAIRFSKSFYYALACGLNYQQAFELGRNAVYDLEEPILVVNSTQDINNSNNNEGSSSSSSSQRRIPRILERGSTEDIDVVADAALYVSDSKHDPKEAIRQAINNGRVCPTKYLYSTNEGCARWLEACDFNRNHNFIYYRDSIELLRQEAQSIIETAKSASSKTSTDFDFISLGCGDGRKDKIILEAMCSNIAENQKVYYYPIDISDPMIVEAIRNVRGNSNESTDIEFRRKILIKAIVGDFTALKPALEFIYEERSNNNFFSILGNTLGNSSENEIVDSLNHAMFPGDFLLIEVNVDQGSLSEDRIETNFYRTEQNQKRQFIPLEVWNVKFESTNMRYSVEVGDSSIDPDNTKTLKTSYVNAVIGDKNYSSINLAKIHHYNYDTFGERIGQKLRSRTIRAWKRNGRVALFLLQKEMS